VAVVDQIPAPFDPPDDATPEELRVRLRALAAMLSRAPIAIAVAHDAECRYISANAALATLLGVDSGSNVSLAVPGAERPYRIQRDGRDVPQSELPMQFAIANRTRVTNDIEIVRRDGTVVYVQNDVEPLYDAHGQVCGCISVCVDMTEHRMAQRVLRDADRAKDEFLATLSHELRNPLAPLRTALEVLRLAAGDPVRAQNALATMERQLKQLVRLTDDLLDVSRITRGRIEMRHESLDLRNIVRHALETMQPLVDAACHTVQVTMPDDAVWVEGDEARLTQAIGALLSNAVKYTDRSGRIEIAVQAGRGSAVATVTDSGIGIKPSELPRIFDLFMQSDRTLDRARGGLGIGLALAKKLIELHGGTLTAHSRGVGQGSTFTFTLPTTDAPQPAAEASPHGERRKRVRARVLVAEDVPDAAEMLRVMLDYMGHEVRVAPDGVEAVAIAGEFKPHVALLDIGLPRMDGYEACRRIRAMLGGEVLVVALTGWGQEEDQRRAEEAGFDLHLTKPAEPSVLEALIASRAPRHRK
jgi:PAS domain S-box-containing protein